MSSASRKLVRLNSVLEQTGGSRSWLYGAIREGEFPKPIKLGKRAIAFFQDEIDEFLSRRSSARNS